MLARAASYCRTNHKYGVCFFSFFFSLDLLLSLAHLHLPWPFCFKVSLECVFFGLDCCFWCVYGFWFNTMRTMDAKERTRRTHIHALTLANQHFYGWVLDSCHVLLLNSLFFCSKPLLAARTITLSYSHNITNTIIVCINFVLFFVFFFHHVHSHFNIDSAFWHFFSVISFHFSEQH